MRQADSRDSHPSGAELVGVLAAGVAVEREFAAARYEQIDAVRAWYESQHGAIWSLPDALEWRDLRAEVAAALGVHERTAEIQLHYARRLLHDFGITLSRLRSARISDRHARIVVDCSVGVPIALLGEYEERVLAKAEILPASRFEKHAAMVAASISPSSMAEQHREAMDDRRVAVEPARHGMAWLHLLLDAPDVLGAKAAITGHARGLHGAPGENRTLAQIEADVARDLLVDSIGVTSTLRGGGIADSPAAQRGVRAEVLLHIPSRTAMGTSDEPGLLDGYGPIDCDTARELSGTSTTWTRLLTDPADGTIVDFGRTTYRVPAELRRYLRVRDEVCRFVGCTRSARYCDLDHTTPWAEDGATVAANLAHLCRGHHRIKGRGRWQVENDGHGTIRCTSPTGRVYESPPAATMSPRSRVRFRDPDDLAGEQRPSTIRDALKSKFRTPDPSPDDVCDAPEPGSWFSGDDED